MARKVPSGRRERCGTGLSHFLPSCPPSLRVLPPFVSFLPSCAFSLCVIPPFVSFLPSCPSMRQSLFFSIYLAISSPLLGQSIVPLPPFRLIFSIMKSNILPMLRLTNGTYHISLYMACWPTTPHLSAPCTVVVAHVVRMVHRCLVGVPPCHRQ